MCLSWNGQAFAEILPKYWTHLIIAGFSQRKWDGNSVSARISLRQKQTDWYFGFKYDFTRPFVWNKEIENRKIFPCTLCVVLWSATCWATPKHGFYPFKETKSGKVIRSKVVALESLYQIQYRKIFLSIPIMVKIRLKAIEA